MTATVQPDFVSIADFCRRSSLSRSTVYAEIERGKLPRPVPLSENRVGLPAEKVEAWFSERRALAESMGEAA